MKSFKNCETGWILIMLSLIIFSGCSPQKQEAVLKNKDLKIVFSEDGNIQNIKLLQKDISFNVKGKTSLGQCIKQNGKFYHEQLDKSCEIKESWSVNDEFIDFSIQVTTGDSAWTTGIMSEFQFENPENLEFWTTWGHPDQDKPSATVNEVDISWHTPFEKRPFADRTLFYGEHCCLGASFAIPLFSVFDKASGKGFTLLMSPDDDLFDVRIMTTKDGKTTIKRYNNRISPNHSPTFKMHLFAHGNDWREVLKIVTEKYPEYFEPVAANALDISGCGAYSHYEGEIDTALYHAMGGIVNWKASFDFPFMGLFIPPVKNDNEKWQRYTAHSSGEFIPGKENLNSINKMASYAKKMKDYGFHTLYYFNVTEFGAGIEYPVPPENAGFEHEVYKNANEFLYSHFPNAILFGTHDQKCWLYRDSLQQINPVPFKQEKPYWTWANAVAMDIGDPAYQEFMLGLARKHVEKFPDIDGICIDRLDWLGEYNHKYDDGVSMVGPYKTRAVQVSWKNFMKKLSPIMHEAGKVVFCNPHIHKTEYFKYADGIFNEGGFEWFKMNLSSFLTLYKPMNNWAMNGRVYQEKEKTIYEYLTFAKDTVKTTPDDFLQKQIFMGVFPMAPFTGNDHSIRPESGMIPYYLDYGEMLEAMKGRKWLLIPGVIQSDEALANIFEVPDGYIVFVFRGDTKAKVVLSGIEINEKELDVIHPGKKESDIARVVKQDGKNILNIPLERGCAMVFVK